ncbi:NAD kinase [Halalkalibacter wakoensis JCM 9140]|uniref:NAD kinase n=1 Tax=Halalkalibacter wakoensis JCM 9140 TaxID=1236970 RepID=W4Q1I5_9BACI|nr:NAD kinase [Halalkalibacter wakoensis]GAE25837.1 NAD kinase [Halalkalibacter wakoensis JCM 9140]
MSSRTNLYLSYKRTNEMEELVNPLKALAEENNFTLVTNVEEANIIASIGGDNAFLQATRKTGFKQDCLYVGVSTDSLGFYTDFSIQDMKQMIHALQNEEVEVRRYPILKVTVDNEKPFYCLNECSIRSNVIKTFVIDVFIDDLHFETFRGDGMIVSTPTGSTAYNMSVNGAVVDPTLLSLQVSEIASLNNNEYRTLGTSFLLGQDRTLTLKVVQDGNDHPIIGVDNEALSIRHAKQLKLQLAEQSIKVLKLKNNSFWEKVQRNFIK